MFYTLHAVCSCISLYVTSMISQLRIKWGPVIRVDWWLPWHWFPLTPTSYLQIFLWRKHLSAALSSVWFKGNDSFFAPGLNSDWLWHGAWLKGACVYDSIRPMRCMETFTGAYERETSVFHGTVWPLWWLFVNMGAACPTVKVIHLEGKSLEKFLRVDAIMLEASPTSRLQFCESVLWIGIPSLFFFFFCFAIFLKKIWVFCNLHRFLLI